MRLTNRFNFVPREKEPREQSVVEESKPKDPSANPKPQSSELVDEVFSLFKEYLNTKQEIRV